MYLLINPTWVSFQKKTGCHCRNAGNGTFENLGVSLIAAMLRVLTVLICVEVFSLDRDGLWEKVKLEKLMGI